MKAVFALITVLILALSTEMLLGQADTPEPAPAAWPETHYAPYVYPAYNTALLARTLGVKYFTLAFVISGGDCAGLWQGSAQLDQYFLVQDLRNLRALGGDVIVSFGGAGGDELALVCPDVESLTAAYQQVIDLLDVTHLDFDIEGDEARNPESLTRRSQAIAALQAANPELHVSFTIAVIPTGLMEPQITILENALEHGVRIDLVNIMTMDYGPDFPPDQMGQNAIDAAENTVVQLAALFPDKSEPELWAMLGITPMIGVNDVDPEVFTLEDAQQVTDFAIERGVGRLSMWSLDRDDECAGGVRALLGTCSGVLQEEYAFSRIFNTVMDG